MIEGIKNRLITGTNAALGCICSSIPVIQSQFVVVLILVISNQTDKINAQFKVMGYFCQTLNSTCKSFYCLFPWRFEPAYAANNKSLI